MLVVLDVQFIKRAAGIGAMKMERRAEFWRSLIRGIGGGGGNRTRVHGP